MSTIPDQKVITDHPTIPTVVGEAYRNSVAHGFWDDRPLSTSPGYRPYLGNKLALIHSEVSEALEALRDGDRTVTEAWVREDGKPEGLASELADIVIRVGDLAGHLSIDLEQAIADKLRFNRTRAPKHGKEF